MQTQHQHPRHRRSWLLIALSAVITGIMAVNILRLLALPEGLAQQLSLSIPSEILISLIWGLVFAWTLWGLVGRKSGTRRRALVLLSMLIGYHAIRLTFYVRADYDQGRLPFVFAVAAAGVLIGLIAVGLTTRERRTLD